MKTRCWRYNSKIMRNKFRPATRGPVYVGENVGANILYIIYFILEVPSFSGK